MKRFLLALAGASMMLNFPLHAALVSAISVVVNDQVITYGEIAEKVAPSVNAVAGIFGNDRERFEVEVRRLRDQEMEDLVDRKLIVHEFTSSGYITNLLESIIDSEITKIIKREYHGDRATLMKTLQAQGRTFEAYRRDLREDFIVGWMKTQNVDETRKILISPLKIEQYYNEHQDKFKMDDQVKLRMITIAPPPDSQPGEAKKIAEEVLAKIDSGVPFQEMASINSSDSYKEKGGERGWIERKDLKEELAKVAFSLKPGQHSGVVEQPEACYILLVEEARAAHVKPLTEVRVEIESTLRTVEKARLRDRWIDRLKNKSYVRYY